MQTSASLGPWAVHEKGLGRSQLAGLSNATKQGSSGGTERAREQVFEKALLRPEKVYNGRRRSNWWAFSCLHV